MRANTSKPERLLRNSPRFGSEIVALAVLTTLIFTPSLTIDAFNPPKFAVFVSGVTYLGLRYWKVIVQGIVDKVVSLYLIFIFTILLLSLFANTYSISERLFGIVGRNFGFITLSALTLMGLYSFQVSKSKLTSPRQILNGLAITNIIVCIVFFLQESGVIFTEFQNDYGVLPSTLGNPNFLSAFVGISILGTLNWTFQNKHIIPAVVIGVGTALYSLKIILISTSIQGLLALAFSIIVLFLIFSLSYFSKFVNSLIFIFVGIVTIILVLSFLGYGPLGERLIGQTLKNRLVYWEIAIRMTLDSPFIGKGYDSYWDNYRLFATKRDFEKLGGPVTSDSPHNIFLDLFVSGGVLLGFLYISLFLLTIFKVSIQIFLDINSRKFDLSKSSLYSIFLSTTAICLISPFQIGLFVWLPIFIGVLLGLSASSNTSAEEKHNKIQGDSKGVASVVLGISLLICNPIFAAVPMATEIRFRTAVENSSFEKLSNVALDWPFSGFRAISIARGIYDSTFKATGDPSDLEDHTNKVNLMRMRALEIAAETVKINERSLEGWSFLLEKSLNTETREIARQRLQRLDPTNPAWRFLPK